MAQGAFPALNIKPPQFQPQQTNPVETLGQFAQLQNLLIGNQTNQQTLAARQAIGSAYSQAIDPKTGMLDSNKLMSIIANDPNASYLAGDVAAQAQSRQEEQYKINQAALAQIGNRLGVYKSAFGPLLANPNAGPVDVYSTIKGLAAAGMPVDEVAGDVAATMPVMDPTKANDPGYQQQYNQAFHGWLQNQWGSNLPGETQAKVFRPDISLVHTGGAIQGVDVNPTTNPGAAATSMPMTLTPGEAVSPVTGVNPDGSTYSMPTATYAQKTGQGGLVGGNAGGGNSIFGTGRVPGQGAPYSGPPAGAAQGGAAGNPPGTIPTGIGPAQQAAATAAGTGSASDLHDLYQTVSTSAPRLYQLNQALSSLQDLGTTGTGPGTDTRNAVMSYLQSVPGIGRIVGGDPSKIANYDEANKYLTAYASNQASNLGAGTDAKLATALSANASTHISNLAATNVVKATIGLERMQQAQAAAFTQSGLPPSSYDQWAASWNKTADARAYAFDLMSPQQRSGVLNGMSGAARTQFLNQVWNAAQSGLVDPGKLGLTGASSGAGASPSAAASQAPAASTIDPNTGLPVGIAP